MLLPHLKFGFVILASFVLSSAVAAKPSERTRVLALCAKTYGATVDQKRNLFSVNEFYILRVTFNRNGRLTQLAVEPKYFYADDHPEWAEPDHFPYLSKTEYQRLVAEVDRIKAKGPVVKPASPISMVTNFTAWRRETHRAAVLEWGEVVDWDAAADVPRLVRFFRVYYSKRAT